MKAKKYDKYGVVGKKFNDWFVLELDPDDPRNGRHFKCRCICGTICNVIDHSLIKEKSKRCIECKRKKGSSVKNMIGKKFGDWLVLSKEGKKFNSYQYLCRCVCGTKKIRHGPALRRGETHRCSDCSNRIKASNNVKHGLSRTKLYKVWSSMKSRCQTPKSTGYKWYGARGIKVCERWQIFENFLEDMGTPQNGLEIDRIDNNGNYEKSNCHWVTHTENIRNSRRMKNIN